jgi:hypothetical protein
MSGRSKRKLFPGKVEPDVPNGLQTQRHGRSSALRERICAYASKPDGDIGLHLNASTPVQRPSPGVVRGAEDGGGGGFCPGTSWNGAFGFWGPAP